MALCHLKFQGIPSLMPFTLSGDPQFYGLEMSLSNILMIGLFHSNTGYWFFLKQKKKSYHSNHVRDHTYMAATYKGNGHMGEDLEICLMYANSFVFEQKIYCSFLQMDGVVHRTWG